MRDSLATRLSRALIGCYPGRWQRRYREEILDVLDQHRASSRTVLSLAGGAMIAHLDADYRMERPVIRIKSDVVKGTALTVGVIAGCFGLLCALFIVVHLQGFISDMSWHPNPTSGDQVLAMTPNQRLLATEAGGETTSAVVTLWSVGSAGATQLSEFEGGATVAIAPDGRTVATAAFGGQATLWNVTHPQHPARLAVLYAGASNALWGEAFSPDSRLLAAAYGGGVALWDVARPAQPRLLTVLDAHVGQVTSDDITFSPDGDLLALASDNGQVTLWNVTRPAHAFPVATMTSPKGAGWFTALAFSPGGQLLAGVTAAGTLLVYRLDNAGRPVLAAIRRNLPTQALYPGGQRAPAGLASTCPGCLVPSYALGFAPGGHDLTVVLDRVMPDWSSRDTVITWQVAASGALGGDTAAVRDTRDAQPELAPDGRTVVDGAPFGSTMVRLWQVPSFPAGAGGPG
jgi:WD40 repeat protein